MVELARRSFLTGLGAALFVAPAIVRASSLMPIKTLEPINIDEMVVLLQRRLEAAEREMARQMAQSLYADVNNAPRGGLDALTAQVEKDGWWKAQERVTEIQSQVPYVRAAPRLVFDQSAFKWKFAA